MIDKPCCGRFDSWRAIRQGRAESRRVFGKLCRLFFGENRIHEEAATAMAIVVGFVSACLCALRIMCDGDQFAFFGAAHGFGQVTVGILKHALGGTYFQYRVTNIRCRHAFAHFHAQCFGKLPVAYHAGCAVMQREGYGQYHVARCREEVGRRRCRSAVHAGFERTHTVPEMQFLIGELFDLLVFAVPDFHAFDAGCDLLAVCADILHHRRADGAWNSGKSFHAFQAKSDAVVNEIIPIAAGFGVDMHDFFVVFGRRCLIKHTYGASRITDHDAIERRVGHEHVGSASDHAQRQAFDVGILDGFDNADTRSRFDKGCNWSAYGDSGEICEIGHGD